MARDKKNKVLDFFGFGSNDEYDEDEEYFEEEEYEAPVRGRKREEEEEYEEEKPRRSRKTKIVPVQERHGAKSSVIIYSPKTYNDAQPLVMQLIQHKHVIIKLSKHSKFSDDEDVLKGYIKQYKDKRIDTANSIYF